MGVFFARTGLDFELDFLQTTLVGRQLSFGLRVRFGAPRRWRSISDVRPTRFQLHDVRLPPKRSATPTGNVFRCLLRLRFFMFLTAVWSAPQPARYIWGWVLRDP